MAYIGGITFLLCYLILILLVSWVKAADVFYPWGSDVNDTLTCSAIYNGDYYPDKPFKIVSQRGLFFFGVKYTQFYVSPNGFISDIAADGLSPGGKRKRFPLATSNSTWDNCNTTADPNCWMNFYYDFSEWSSLLAGQNDSDVCVNGKSITANFDYDNTHWQTGSQVTYTFINDPSDCLQLTEPYHNHPNWMIAVYWTEMEVVVEPAKLMFRETDDSSILSMAKSDVESLSTVTTFNPQWAFVVTWYYLTYAQGYSYPNSPENSFQIVLVTDGTETYGIYNFNQTELGGGTVGFDSGDGTNYCSFIGSRTASIRYVSDQSNINKPGRWVLPFSPNFDKNLCEPLRTESVSCECDAGWEGRLCAVSIDDCQSNPCPSYASCTDGHLNYTCDYCYKINCLNDGECLNLTDSFFCNCTGNFSGSLCELCGHLACQNGASCGYNPGTSAHVCECAEGFSGKTCEVSSASQSGLSTLEISLIAAGSALALILLGLGILLCCVLTAKKRKKEEDKVKPFIAET